MDLKDLTPEQLEILMQGAQVPEQQKIRENQIAMAQALRKHGPKGQAHSLAEGLLGGIGEGLENTAGYLQERKLRQQQQGLLGLERQGGHMLGAQAAPAGAPAPQPAGLSPDEAALFSPTPHPSPVQGVGSMGPDAGPASLLSPQALAFWRNGKASKMDPQALFGMG